MSASDQMRAMLDQLMGTQRNGESAGTKYSDPKVCKSFLLACCPHDILAATNSSLILQRMDLGECPRIHDLALRADFEAAQKLQDHFYDVDACDHLASFVSDCDRKTEQAKKKLAETQEALSDEVTGKANSVHDFAEQIGKKLAAAELLGAEGDVEGSIKLMEEVEEIRKNKAEAEQDYRNSMPASSYQQQKLRVCEVCSAYLGIHDNDRRLADHFGGKLHLGFIQIREKLVELQGTMDIRRPAKREAKMLETTTTTESRSGRKDVEERRRERGEHRDDRDHRERRRSRSRERRRRTRSRSRDRHRRRRSRSRSRHRRHHKRSRSRGERRRRSRSGSRDIKKERPERESRDSE